MKTRTEPANTKIKTRCSRKDWLAHINAWKTSGLTQVSYCRQQSLCHRQFVKWNSHFKKEMADQQTPGNLDRFIPVQITGERSVIASSAETMTITLPNKISLTLCHHSSKFSRMTPYCLYKMTTKTGRR